MAGAGEQVAGAWGQMRRLDVAVRLGMHSFVIARSVATAKSERERRRRVVAAAITLGIDAWRISNVDAPRGRDRVVGQAVDAAVAGWWASAVGPDPIELRALVMAPVFPNAIGEAALMSAGRRGQPVIPGARVWPVVDRGDAFWRTARLGFAALGPWAMAAGVRIRQGRQPGWAVAGWGILAGAMGVSVARSRAHQQVVVSQRWEERTRVELDRTAAEARYESVAVSGPRHELGKVMWGVAIGADDELFRRARTRLSLPAQHDLSDPYGRIPLGRLLIDHRIEPAEAAAWWVSQQQADRIKRTLAHGDIALDEALSRGPGAVPDDDAVWDDTVQLDRAVDGTISIHYRGNVARARPARDAVSTWKDVVVALDPVSIGLFAMGVVKAAGWTGGLGTVPVPIALAASVSELVAATALLYQFPTRDLNPRFVIAASGLGCGIWMLAVAAGRTAEHSPHGGEVYAATLGTSVLGPIGHYAAELPRAEREAAIAAVALGWLWTMSRRRNPISLVDWLGEGIVVSQYLASAWGFAKRIDAERASLDPELESALEVRVALETARVRLEEHRSALRDIEDTRELLLGEGIGDLDAGDVARFTDDLAIIEQQLLLEMAHDVAEERVGSAKLERMSSSVIEPSSFRAEVQVLRQLFRRERP